MDIPRNVKMSEELLKVIQVKKRMENVTESSDNVIESHSYLRVDTSEVKENGRTVPRSDN